MFTNSAKKGIVNQKDYFDRDIANENNLKGYYIVEKDDFIYNPRISIFAPVGPIKRNHIGTGVMSPLYSVFKIDRQFRDFLELYFETTYWHKYMQSIANYGVRYDRMNITTEGFFKIPLLIPDIKEQERINSFFSKLNEKINLLYKNLQFLEQYKIGMMQKLFSQEFRFKDENENDFPNWEKKRINDLFKERKEKGNKTYSELLSVSISKGVKKQSLSNKTDNSSTDKSNYKVVHINDIAYNSMRMWQGASGVSKYNGIVSPAYTVIIPEENQNPFFYGFYFKTSKVLNIFQRNSQGLTSDTWNLKFNSLSNIKLDVPTSRLEQTKIANFLSLIDDKINCCKKEICISVFNHTPVMLAITSLSNNFSPKYLLFNLYTNSSR